MIAKDGYIIHEDGDIAGEPPILKSPQDSSNLLQLGRLYMASANDVILPKRLVTDGPLRLDHAGYIHMPVYLEVDGILSLVNVRFDKLPDILKVNGWLRLDGQTNVDLESLNLNVKDVIVYDGVVSDRLQLLYRLKDVSIPLKSALSR